MLNKAIKLLAQGGHFFGRGFQLIAEPDLRLFILIPFVINLGIFSILSYWAVGQFSELLELLLGSLPEWLVAVTQWLLSFIFGLILLITMGYTFTLVANLIAAPFNGLLAEKIEIKLTGQAPPPENILSMLFRTLGRELRKWLYFIPRSLGVLILCAILFFIPPLNLCIPFISFIWGAWCMAIQYTDYPIDNHQLDFNVVKQKVSTHRYSCFGFGSCVMLASSIPIINFFIMPVAIAGATALAIENKMLTETDEGEITRS